MHARAAKCAHFDSFDNRLCSEFATSIVNGELRCDEHTPKVEPLTEARAEELEIDALIDEIAFATPVNGPRLRFRRRYGRRYFGSWLEDDDPDYYDGDEADFW